MSIEDKKAFLAGTSRLVVLLFLVHSVACGSGRAVVTNAGDARMIEQRLGSCNYFPRYRLELPELVPSAESRRSFLLRGIPSESFDLRIEVLVDGKAAESRTDLGVAWDELVKAEAAIRVFAKGAGGESRTTEAGGPVRSTWSIFPEAEYGGLIPGGARSLELASGSEVELEVTGDLSALPKNLALRLIFEGGGNRL